MSVHLLTVVTNSLYPGYRNYLEASCKHFGAKCVLLGTNTKWEGLEAKVTLLREGLSGLPDDALIFFLDGYDSFLNRSLEQLASVFETFKHPLIFSAEKNPFPDPSYATRSPRTQSRWKYLNSGGFMGRAGHLRSLLSAHSFSIVPSEFRGNDQSYWNEVFLQSPGSIKLDTECQIFQTLSYTSFSSEVAFNGKEWRNLVTGTVPFQIHFNGSSRPRFLPFSVNQGLPWAPTPFRRPLRVVVKDELRLFIRNQKAAIRLKA